MPGIAIPSGDLWSFNAALIEFVAGRLGLKGLWNFKDDFTGTSIDSAIWNTATNSSGEVVLLRLYDRVYAFSETAANAAMLIVKETFKTNEDWALEGIVSGDALSGIGELFALVNTTTSPVPVTNAIYTDQRTITISDMAILYIDNTGSFVSWDGSAWQAGSGATFSLPNFPHTLGKFQLQSFDDSGTMKWKIFVYDSDDILRFTTTPVAWSATRQPTSGNILWGFFGSPRTNVLFDSTNIYSVIRWSTNALLNYSDASPVATSPWFAIDQNTLDAVTAILLQLILENTSTIKFQWALNNGAFNGSFLTPAQLLAALVGQTITDHTDSMRLMAQFNSNGADQALLLVPQTKAEASGISAGGSQADIADVRNGTIYNDGALTGTAFIPAKSDTRKDTPVDDGVGTLAVVPASDTRDGVPTDDTVGNYEPAIEANHALGDSYGSFGTEFTGTKALTPFKLPVEVILEDSEILVFEGAE